MSTSTTTTTNGNGKPLRFAALIRVSSEKQAKKGESLRTQTSQIDGAVKALAGTIAIRYAGQEHATAGWERQQLDKMLADAEKPRRAFDAVIVADCSRWSRDNVRNETGLETLRKAGVRFFVLSTEYDLYNPEQCGILSLFTAINALSAGIQRKKSIENKIKRAERGRPACGRLPFGRVWDKETEKWSIDPKKQALIEDVAQRYLKGESLPKLAKEHGLNHSNLTRVLRERCGSEWVQEFNVPEFKINQSVTTKVPRLLDEKTIKDVRAELAARRTYRHKPPRSVYGYLLSGFVFCAGCGYRLNGQVNEHRRRYYRHRPRRYILGDSAGQAAPHCPYAHPRPWIAAGLLEESVLGDLFQMFGNPAQIERAVKAAVPDAEKALKHKERLEGSLKDITRARDRLLDLVIKDAISQEQADKKLRDLKAREESILEELDKVSGALAALPDEDAVRLVCDRLGSMIVVYDPREGPGNGEHYAGGNDVATFIQMTEADKLELFKAVFSEPLPDGKPAGVYITPSGGTKYGRKSFTYELRGRLAWRVTPRALS
jgi:site-specific DNA recombinase